MTTLISFLGKKPTTRDAKEGYRSATYRFDADFSREVTFFGLALADYIKPSRLILVGTASSMWEVFFADEAGNDDELLKLIDAVAEERVTQEQLQGYSRRLADKLGYQVDCQLIPFARTEAEQMAILAELAAAIEENERIVLDVTHSFRHLPMLALVAARYLKHVRHVEVDNIYYGALDMCPPGGEVPVLRLDGMLKMLDWVETLASYEKDGDYGPFAELLKTDGMEPDRAELLKKAAFYERTSNPVKARETLRSLFPSVEAHQGPLGSFFRDELIKRISWFRGNGRDKWEQNLATGYMRRKDYLRAALFQYEAFATRATMDRQKKPNDFNDRKEAFEELEDQNPEFKELRILRNSMVHGLRSKGKILTTLNDEKKLQGRLQAFIKKFLAF